MSDSESSPKQKQESAKAKHAPKDLALNMPSKEPRIYPATQTNWANWRNWLAAGLAASMVGVACYFSFMDIETRKTFVLDYFR